MAKYVLDFNFRIFYFCTIRQWPDYVLVKTSRHCYRADLKKPKFNPLKIDGKNGKDRKKLLEGRNKERNHDYKQNPSFSWLLCIKASLKNKRKLSTEVHSKCLNDLWYNCYMPTIKLNHSFFTNKR